MTDSGDLVLDGAPSGETPPTKCPNCDGLGWYPAPDSKGNPEQVQCVWCGGEMYEPWPRSVRDIPPAISEALDQPLRDRLEALGKLLVYRLEKRGSSLFVVLSPREAEDVVVLIRAAILSALPREEPQPAPAECADCGAPMNGGEAATFTVCSTCWDRHYRPAPSGEALEAKIRERAVTHFGSLESWVPLRDVITLIRAQFGSPPSPTSKEG